MAKYLRVPTYTFLSTSDTGINEIPKGSTIQVFDDVNSIKSVYFKMSNNGLTSSSTVQDFLNDNSLYKDIEGGVDDAPSDGKAYLRVNGIWEELDGGSF